MKVIGDAHEATQLLMKEHYIPQPPWVRRSIGLPLISPEPISRSFVSRTTALPERARCGYT